MDNVVKAEEVIDYSFGETKYNFTIEIIELEKLMISIFNGHTGVTYKTYLQKDDEWYKSNIYIFRGEFSRIFPLLQDSLLKNKDRLPHQEIEEPDQLKIIINYEDDMYPFELVICVPKYVSENGPLEDRINSLEYQVSNLKRLLYEKREKVKEGNKIYNEVGNLIYEGSMKNGKRHGQGIEYCGTKNTLLYEGGFKDGYYEGQGTIYPDGNANSGTTYCFKKTGNFQQGLFHGLIEEYNNHNIVTSTIEYVSGKMDGKHESYSYNGTKRWLSSVYHYKDNEQHGKTITYDETGKVASSQEYNMGKVIQ